MEASHEPRLAVRSEQVIPEETGLVYADWPRGSVGGDTLAEALARLGYERPKVEADFDLSLAVLEQPPQVLPGAMELPGSGRLCAGRDR